jgi:S-adenosylmethionine hydrolase
MSTIVILTTDFGTADGYVGEMKAVLHAQAPGATIVDITHDIPRHDVAHARLAVARFWRRFPSGTVHLVVVDPGVGSPRAALAVTCEGRYLVGPDNGVLSPALVDASATAVALRVPADASATFHGRDVFAPAAAALARGEPITALGSPPDNAPIVHRIPEPVRGPGGTIEGEVVAIDRFGNAITNLTADGVAAVVVGQDDPDPPRLRGRGGRRSARGRGFRRRDRDLGPQRQRRESTASLSRRQGHSSRRILIGARPLRERATTPVGATMRRRP